MAHFKLCNSDKVVKKLNLIILLIYEYGIYFKSITKIHFLMINYNVYMLKKNIVIYLNKYSGNIASRNSEGNGLALK